MIIILISSRKAQYSQQMVYYGMLSIGSCLKHLISRRFLLVHVQVIDLSALPIGQVGVALVSLLQQPDLLPKPAQKLTAITFLYDMYKVNRFSS